MHFSLSRAVSLMLGVFACWTHHAQAATFTTLYTFSGGADGGSPSTELRYRAGHLIGGTGLGGASGHGVLFSLELQTDAEAELHNFGGGATDGAQPSGQLAVENNILYGTTLFGGATGCYSSDGSCGTIYQYDFKHHAETVLHSFTNHDLDGGNPESGLVFSNGIFYGTTVEGGVGQFACNYDCGTFYKFDLATGIEQVLYSFTGSINDAGDPLELTKSGPSFYGITSQYGDCLECGTVFKIDTTGAEKTITSFSSVGDDGSPRGGVILVGGRLYGTTSGDSHVLGSLFKINPATGKETVLHSFQGISDGATPVGKLIYMNGALYGITTYGGANYGGAIYKFDLSTGIFTLLHSFTGQSDGGYPMTGMTLQNGVLYGTTTASHGSYTAGTIFSFVP